MQDLWCANELIMDCRLEIQVMKMEVELASSTDIHLNHHILLIFSFSDRNQIMNSMLAQRNSHRSTKSTGSTDLDSSFETVESPTHAKTNPCKHKTELCKTYSLLGYCNYGEKCRFAHGAQDLVQVRVEVGSKSRKCNGFWRKGNCCYGIRCQFGHARLEWEDKCCLLGLETLVSGGITSKLLPLLH